MNDITKETTLYFRYRDEMENERSFVVNSFYFDSLRHISRPFKLSPPSQGKVKVLKCLCGAINWTANGRFINEYECDSCGQFIEVTERVKTPEVSH